RDARACRAGCRPFAPSDAGGSRAENSPGDGRMTALDFALPSKLEAHEPPEVRGTGRDDVRMIVSDRASGRVVDAHFRSLPDFLHPGDVLVVNTSATVPAALT